MGCFMVLHARGLIDGEELNRATFDLVAAGQV